MKNVEDLYDLTHTQEGILFQTLYASEPGVYIEQLMFTFEGELDAAHWRDACQQVLERHPALRTGFLWEGIDRPVQVVFQKKEIPWTRLDWKNEPADCLEERLTAFLKEDRAQGFTLANAPLLRCALIETSANSWRFIWSHHHILMDGWSWPLLFQDVFQHYLALRQGKRSELPPPPAYRNYIAWMQKQDASEAERYWKETLHGMKRTPLPFKKNDPKQDSEQGNRFDQESLTLDESTTANLRALIQSHRLTMSALFQGLWGLLLSRYSGESEVTFGVVVSGRPSELSGVEKMVGLFINTLPARVQVEPEPMVDWLQTLKTAQQEREAHGFFPLAKIQNWSDIPSGTPLFESLVAFENYPVDHSARKLIQDFEVIDFKAFENTGYPLNFIISDSKELSFKILYDKTVFDPQAVSQLLEHLKNLLVSFQSEPQQTVTQMPMLTAQEQRFFQEAEVHTPEPRFSLPQLFEAQVQERPQDIALTFCAETEGTKEELTYRALNERANRLASHLRSRGVKPEVRVGLLLERSVEMVVGILAVLKAGGAYVPIDPEYPAKRISFVLEDAQVAILLSQKSQESAAKDFGGEVLLLDHQSFSDEPSDNLSNTISPSNLAYVIYTSGSTGLPKGVEVTHSNVARLMEVNESKFGFCKDDVWPLFHSYAFDWSVWEIWGALLYGGKLVVVPYWTSRSPLHFAELLVQEGVTFLNQTPSHFYQLIRNPETLNTLKEAPLRRIVFGGEPLDAKALKPWFDQPGEQPTQLINMFGITETTVHVTYYKLKAEDANTGKSSIGLPLDDLQVYLLDSNLEPVPFGIPGEIYVSGRGVARSYLRRPELTAQRFIPNPFSKQVGSRLYRSGDLARRLPNGELEHMGRVDHQIKIRGFRIELGEIANALLQHPMVGEALAVVQGSENRFIVAYLIVQSNDAPTDLKLHQEFYDFLKDRLPSYMIPRRFVTLENFPLNTNGKIDLEALPHSEHERPELGSVYAPPTTPSEEILSRIWKKVLNVEKIGIHDNYFELGGDSILSIQVLGFAKEAGLSFTLQEFFQSPTISELAQAIDRASAPVQDKDTEGDGAAFQLISEDDRKKLPEGLDDAYPLGQLQAGMVYHNETAPNAAVYHDVFSFHVKISFDLEKLEKAIRVLAKRHEILRSGFDYASYSEPLQLVWSDVLIPLTMFDLRDHSSDSQPQLDRETLIADWVNQEKNVAIDWNNPPLLSFFLHQWPDNTFHFSISFHHAILDGWSLAYLLTELFHLYQMDDPSLMPPNESNYRDFIALEQEAMESGSSHEFWEKHLEGLTLAKLPRWPDTPERLASNESELLDVSLDPELVGELKQLAGRLKVPMKSVFLAAHLRVMMFISNQKEIVTGLLSSGRPEAKDGEKVIGLFLNMLALRFKFDGGSWEDLIQQTFELEQTFFPHRRYPIAQLQQEFGQKDGLFEIVFNYVKFHVYRSLSDSTDIDFLGGKFYDRTNFPLLINVIQNAMEDKVNFTFNYPVKEFSKEQVVAISGYLVETLKAMTNDAQARYELMLPYGEEERHKIEYLWNRSERPYPKDRLTHQLFAAQAQKTPEADACVFEGKGFSYQTLDEASNRMARFLQSQGVGPGSIVGVCLERNIDMLTALLGVFKSGGAYLPLDPEYPKERIRYMLSNSQASLLLTEESVSQNVEQAETPTFFVDRDQDLFSSQEATPVECHASSSDLAYVVYTSGSTGKPKGVAVEHMGVATLMQWAQEFFLPDELRGVLASTSICFDLSVFELFAPLCSGGTVFLVKNILDLPFMEERSRLSLINTVPSAIKEMLRIDGVPPNVEIVNMGGEALNNELAQEIYRKTKVRKVWNLYGPSEDTVYSMYALAEKGSSEPITIGRPIANTQTHVLDRFHKPTPIGVPGELHLGGRGLAQGYLGQPTLSAEKFVPNPFANESDSTHIAVSSRLYKTGDLARYLPDGRIEFLGRLDHLVKVRGFGIELAEVETAMAKHPLVESCAVTVKKDPSGDSRLVAFVVPHPDADDLQEDLSEQDRFRESLSQWRFLWDNVYQSKTSTPQETSEDPTLNIVGWNSSYTGEQMKHSEMKEWLDGIAERILAFKPKRVLEIGCGTGMILFRLAPQCEQYTGIDLSPNALEYIEKQLSILPEMSTRIALHLGDADGWTHPDQEPLDTVVLNSVVQYFPDIHYLRRVLKKSIAAISGRGQVFVGDVRSAVLLESYHASVRFAKEPDHMPLEEFVQGIRQRVKQERELTLHPAFFHTLKALFPEIKHVIVQPKRGLAHNELTRFRYDVVLIIDKTDNELTAPLVVDYDDWEAEDWSMEKVRKTLQTSASKPMAWKGIPNGRLSQENQLLAQLNASSKNVSVLGDLRKVLQSSDEVNGIDPEQWETLAQELGYNAFLSWSESDSGGHYSVILVSQGSLQFHHSPFPWFEERFPVIHTNEYANQPGLWDLSKKISDRLLLDLKSELPHYMIPSHCNILESLPLTPNGKINRKALIDPDSPKERDLSNFKAPRTPIEETLAGIWSELLGLDSIGIYDNFFELGGHSLIMVRLYSLIQQKVPNDLKMVDLLHFPTVGQLAQRLEGNLSPTDIQSSWVDPEQEAQLDLEIQPPTTMEAEDIPLSSIFLTGATGFVGAFLLKELLAEGTGPIFCLVRADDELEGQQRLTQAMQTYGLWDNVDVSRIVPIPGDLGEPLFGLSPERFSELARQVRVIVHNGALVNFALPYALAKGANVDGTVEILRLATEARIKPVHFISTVGIFSNMDLPANESSRLEDQRHSSVDGYASSKWIAEHLIGEAQKRGIPCSTYRLGRMTGAFETGACNPDDFFHRVVRGCLALKKVPENLMGGAIDMTPVDFAVRGIVALVKSPESLGKTYHLIHPQRTPVAQVLTRFEQEGYRVEVLPYDKWLKAVIDWNREFPDSPFQVILPFLNDWNPEPSTAAVPFRIESEWTCQQLSELGVDSPPEYGKLLKSYFAHWKSRQWI